MCLEILDGSFHFELVLGEDMLLFSNRILVEGGLTGKVPRYSKC